MSDDQTLNRTTVTMNFHGRREIISIENEQVETLCRHLDAIISRLQAGWDEPFQYELELLNAGKATVVIQRDGTVLGSVGINQRANRTKLFLEWLPEQANLFYQIMLRLNSEYDLGLAQLIIRSDEELARLGSLEEIASRTPKQSEVAEALDDPSEGNMEQSSNADAVERKWRMKTAALIRESKQILLNRKIERFDSLLQLAVDTGKLDRETITPEQEREMRSKVEGEWGRELLSTGDDDALQMLLSLVEKVQFFDNLVERIRKDLDSPTVKNVRDWLKSHEVRLSHIQSLMIPHRLGLDPFDWRVEGMADALQTAKYKVIGDYTGGQVTHVDPPSKAKGVQEIPDESRLKISDCPLVGNGSSAEWNAIFDWFYHDAARRKIDKINLREVTNSVGKSYSHVRKMHSNYVAQFGYGPMPDETS